MFMARLRPTTACRLRQAAERWTTYCKRKNKLGHPWPRLLYKILKIYITWKNIMALPDNYTVKPGSIPDYFEAILNAEAPERFTNQFLTNLDFKSTNDRLFIWILKDLGFIDTDGAPKTRYYKFLDRSQSKIILAEGIQEAYSDLLTINKKAYKMSLDEVKNKSRILYAVTKKDDLINRIASTFVALCDYADFTSTIKKEKKLIFPILKISLQLHSNH
jgi:hypothetical protein